MSANEQRDGIEGRHRSGASSVARPDAEGGALARWWYLLRIAAGDGDAAQEAIEVTGKRPETVQAAVAFFIEQSLFTPDSTAIAPWERDSAQPVWNYGATWRCFSDGCTRTSPNGRSSSGGSRPPGTISRAINARENEHRIRRAGRFSRLPVIPRHPSESRYPGEGNSGKMREPFQAIGVHRRKRDPSRRVFLFVLCRR